MNSSLVPENKIGTPVDIEYSITESSIAEADTTYNRACARLLNPPVWKQLSGAIGASFAIETPQNEDARRLVQVNDYLKIAIPGPGTVAGEGFDWVRVEAIEENTLPDAEGSFGIKVRACANPEQKEKGTAHFFTNEATSSFIIKKNGATVSMAYHGRNEMANTTDVPVLDTIRNAVVATGAVAGLSEMHWTALLKGMLKKEIGG